MQRGTDNNFASRGKTKFVAWVDIVLSCLMLAIILIALIAVLGQKNDNRQEIAVGNVISYPQEAVYGGRLVLEIISIFLAAKLLESSNPTVARDTPEQAKKWCTIWIISCATWIFFLVFGIIIKIAEAVHSDESGVGVIYMQIMILVGIVVLRLGAVVLVLGYKRELKAWMSQEMHALSA